jgi:transcriptional pleiotropic regulator of transition state genes
MKSTGIVRKVDELGRCVIPIELRRTLNINEGDGLEIFVDGDKVILRKYEPDCIFCGNADGITNFKGKNICPDCIGKMSMLDVEAAARKSVVGGKK